jgi:hypothetical protein
MRGAKFADREGGGLRWRLAPRLVGIGAGHTRIAPLGFIGRYGGEDSAPGKMRGDAENYSLSRILISF